MDFERMARRVAASPRRRAILTTKANMNKDASGVPRVRDVEELAEHLAKSWLNAVLIENGAKDGWVAVFAERDHGQYEVAKVPTDGPGNVLGKKLDYPSDALSAALQL